MDYNIELYKKDSKNEYRYALGVLSERTLFVIGLNPSTADEQSPDPTIRKVMGFAERNNYTSFVMLNLYPQRSPYPDDLPYEADKDELKKNITIISDLIKSQKEANVLLA